MWPSLLLLFSVPTPLAQAQWVYDDDSTGRPVGCASESDGEVSVFWWNVRFGSMERAALQTNLQTLAQSACAPQFVALGEYENGNLDPETAAALETRYPFHRYLPYSLGVPWRGVQIYSRLPVMRTDSSGYMDWLDPHLARDERSAARDRAYHYYTAHEARLFDRRLNRITVQTPRGELTLYPTHLAQPFAIEARRHEHLRIVRQLLWDTENPLGHQVRSLLRHIDPNTENAVIFGDLNFPPAVGQLEVSAAPHSNELELERLEGLLAFTNDLGRRFFRTPYYQAFLDDGWADAFGGHGPATFPSRDAPEAAQLTYQLHPFQFDHIFRSPQVETRGLRSPHLTGSDHYPIFFIARLHNAR